MTIKPTLHGQTHSLQQTTRTIIAKVGDGDMTPPPLSAERRHRRRRRSSSPSSPRRQPPPPRALLALLAAVAAAQLLPGAAAGDRCVVTSATATPSAWLTSVASCVTSAGQGQAKNVYSSLSAALTSSANGDIIWVDVGVHTDNGAVTVSTSVAIRGRQYNVAAGPSLAPSGRNWNYTCTATGANKCPTSTPVEETIIVRSNDAGSTTKTSNAVIIVNTAGVVIDGLIITSTASATVPPPTPTMEGVQLGDPAAVNVPVQNCELRDRECAERGCVVVMCLRLEFA